MRRIFLMTATLAAITAAPALAKPGCPPGLAKRTPACVPPGLARKGVSTHEWRRGDIIYDDYVIIRDRWRYDLPPLADGEAYVRVGDAILRVERETLQVIALIGLLADLSN